MAGLAAMAGPRGVNWPLNIEWPTVAVLVGCYGLWLGIIWLAGHYGSWPLLAIASLLVTLHSSLQHEMLHGHPTRSQRVNELLVFFPLGVFYPYRRFRALHLQHHRNEWLTDPYEDPESFYRDPGKWRRLNQFVKWLLEINNTLAGRLLIGTALAVIGFTRSEIRAMRQGDGEVIRAWLLHGLGLIAVIYWVVVVCNINFALYVLLSAYPGTSLLMLRTYAEHQAVERIEHRTAIVENGGPFAFLFLNNNLHFVHHMFAGAPWYALPRLYRQNRELFIAANGGYVFETYGQMARAYAFKAKEPVPHPLMEVAARMAGQVDSTERRLSPDRDSDQNPDRGPDRGQASDRIRDEQTAVPAA